MQSTAGRKYRISPETLAAVLYKAAADIMRQRETQLHAGAADTILQVTDGTEKKSDFNWQMRIRYYWNNRCAPVASFTTGGTGAVSLSTS